MQDEAAEGPQGLASLLGSQPSPVPASPHVLVPNAANISPLPSPRGQLQQGRQPQHSREPAQQQPPAGRDERAAHDSYQHAAAEAARGADASLLHHGAEARVGDASSPHAATETAADGADQLRGRASRAGDAGGPSRRRSAQRAKRKWNTARPMHKAAVAPRSMEHRTGAYMTVRTLILAGLSDDKLKAVCEHCSIPDLRCRTTTLQLPHPTIGRSSHLIAHQRVSRRTPIQTDAGTSAGGQQTAVLEECMLASRERYISFAVQAKCKGA